MLLTVASPKTEEKPREEYDVVIIGGGPAGLSASMYLARAKLRVVVIDKGGGALEKDYPIENYFGVPNATGRQLLETGRKQAEEAGAILKLGEEALSIKPNPLKGTYIVETNKSEYEAPFLIFAIGLKRGRPPIKNIEKFEGKGVSYCATCDAPFFNGKVVGVIGFSDYTVKEAVELSHHASKVYFLTNGNELKVSDQMKEHLKNFEIIDKKIVSCFGEEKLEGIEFQDGSKLNLDGLFIALDPSSPETLARTIGVEIERNKIKTDKLQRTNVPNIYAAGDCANNEIQIGTAVGDGIRAALDIIRNIRKIKT